jgi:zinc/manganese transport system permease protein
MFSGFMVNAWEVASIVAVVAGVVGFFVVLRGSAFAAHAIPNGSFAGAAGASLVGVSTLLGLGAFSLTAALGIGLLGRRGRHDAVTALVLVMMLALGALFLSLSGEYAPETFSLLFGEVLGVSNNDLAATAGLAVACVAAVAILYRRLLLSSALAEVGEARGVGAFRLELCFLAVVALASTMTVPVVGTLLIFSLMIGPPAGARALTDSPARALLLSVALALVTVWAAIAASYITDYPVGFFVGTLSAVSYALGRAVAGLRGADSSRARAAPARLGSSHA